MEENTFPPVLMNLINTINAEGRLESWKLHSTLETHSLTLEWTRSAFCNIDLKSLQSDSTPENLAEKPDQTVGLNADCGEKYSSKGIYVTGRDAKTARFDFSTRCLRTLENNDKGDCHLNTYSESEIPEAMTTENNAKYDTQISVQGRPHSLSTTLNVTQVCQRNSNWKTPINLAPLEDNIYHTDYATDELADNRVTGTDSKPLIKQDSRKKKAICSCGELFSSRNSSVSHLLSSCPVSICFRIELECNVQRVIESWHGDQKVIGKAWWQSYKSSGFPDVTVELKDEIAKQLRELVNQFIERATTQTLKDQNGNAFVLISGLNDLED